MPFLAMFKTIGGRIKEVKEKVQKTVTVTVKQTGPGRSLGHVGAWRDLDANGQPNLKIEATTCAVLGWPTTSTWYRMSFCTAHAAFGAMTSTHLILMFLASSSAPCHPCRPS